MSCRVLSCPACCGLNASGSGVTAQAIADALDTTNGIAASGIVEAGAERVRMQVTGAFGSVEAIGATPSIGTVGDSYDNALAETVNGYYKAELVRGPARSGPWKTVENLELATLGWVHWHNTQRLHSYLGDVPPAEFENAFYAVQADREHLVGIK